MIISIDTEKEFEKNILFIHNKDHQQVRNKEKLLEWTQSIYKKPSI